MSYLGKFLIFILTSHALISSMFLVNFYTVFNEDITQKSHCYSVFKSDNIELCYNFMLVKKEYCAIGGDENG